MNIKAVINDKPLRNLLKDYNKRIKSKTKRTTEDIARKAVMDIRSNMPIDTGQSRKSMWYLLAFDSKYRTEVQITQWVLPHPEKTWNSEWFNLPLYMFEGKDPQFRTGNIPKMRVVPDRIADEFELSVRRDLAEQWQLSK